MPYEDHQDVSTPAHMSLASEENYRASLIANDRGDQFGAFLGFFLVRITAKGIVLHATENAVCVDAGNCCDFIGGIQ